MVEVGLPVGGNSPLEEGYRAAFTARGTEKFRVNQGPRAAGILPLEPGQPVETGMDPLAEQMTIMGTR